MQSKLEKKSFTLGTFINGRSLLSVLVVGGALSLVGCGSSSGADCEDGWHREFACGKDLTGLQPQQCVDGKWESINFCALADGTKHPDANDHPYDPDAGKENDKNDKPDGPNKEDDPDVERPKNADGCIELVNDDVNGGKTLTSDECYVVNKTVTVKEGTLKIDPGTTILFKKDTHLAIKDSGRLNAVGKSGKSIWFQGTQEEKGFWGGLVFYDTGSGENDLAHVVVRHAGSSKYNYDSYSRGGVFVFNGAKLNISESLFEQNLYAGLNVVSPTSVIELGSSTFKNNEVALRLSANQLSMLEDDLVLADNKDADKEDSNYILLERDVKIDKSGIWSAYTYRNEANIEINSAIEIKAGAVFQTTKQKGIIIKGENATLKAEGTADQPIVFTSKNESSSSWRGLWFTDTNSPNNLLKHVIVEKAGDSKFTYDDYSTGAVYVDTANVILAMEDITFKNNADVALRLWDGKAKITLDNAKFIDNNIPIATAMNHIGNFGENLTFEGSDEQSIQIRYGTNVGVSTASTWLTYSIPYEVFVEILVNAPLTLSAGSTLVFHPKAGIHVKGLNAALIAKADGGDRITMKGTQNTKGAWRGVQFLSKNPSNELNGVDIINSGDSSWNYDKWGRAALLLRDGSSAIVKDTKIENSDGYGVSVVQNSELIGCEGLSVTGSTDDDFYGITGIEDCK